MAITPAQRQTALQQIIVSALGSSAIPLSTLLPGITPAEVLSALVTALGTTADTYFTDALTVMGAHQQTQLTAAQGAVTAIQAEVTALTVV